MLKSRYALLAIVAIAVLAMNSGCNGGITNPMTQLDPGALSVDFPDGSELLVQSGTIYSINGSNYIVTAISNVSGANDGDEITLTVPIDTTVPYTVSSESNGAVDVTYNDNETQANYEGKMGQGNCTITITQTSPTLIGNFSAEEVGTSTSDTIELTNGQFNATPQ